MISLIIFGLFTFGIFIISIFKKHFIINISIFASLIGLMMSVHNYDMAYGNLIVLAIVALAGYEIFEVSKLKR